MNRTTHRLKIALMSGLVLTMATMSSAKTRSTYYRSEELSAIRARAADPRYAAEVKAIVAKADEMAKLSDQEIWDLVPPADLTRAIAVRYESDCPVHGKEIYKAGGRWPWITSSDKPFVVECPVGHETYPSNDFNAYLKAGRKEKLDTREKYVDDGNGYIDADGNHYHFAGYYNFWHRWRKQLVDGTAAMGSAYVLTGDAKYAHKAAVALAAISRVYPQMDYAKQASHNGKWPAAINGRILDYIWENQVVMAYAVTYDAIYPTLGDNAELNRFLAEKGVPDVRQAIERDILQEMARDLLAKKIWGNKFELRSTAAVALVLDNKDKSKGVTSDEMVEWLLKGGGDMEFTFYNGFDRDGWGGESSLSYSNIWAAASIAAAEDLSRMGVAMAKDAKWRNIAKAALKMRLLDTLVPRIGDVDGKITGNTRYVLNDALMFAVTQFNDADSAALLLKQGEYKPPLLSRTTIDADKLKAIAADATYPDAPYTRDFGGYGLAVLELNDGAQTHSATVYYGSPMASHGHNDRLTMSYHLGNRDIFPEMGYPSLWGAVADWWIKNTPSHYAVMVNEEPQTARYAGYLTRFVDGEGIKFAEAQGKSVWGAPPLPAEVPAGSIGGEKRTTKPTRQPPGPPVTDYRRMLALLDTGDKSTLVAEAFIVAGGRQHDYAFHGLPYGEFAILNANKTREQKQGTLAGEDIEVGKDPGKGKIRSGFQFLSSPRWYEPADATQCVWTNDGGYNLSTWFPKLSIDEIVIADGVPPTYPGSPASMPFLLLRHRGENDATQSLFVSISDAVKGDSAVQKVKTIKSDHALAGGASVTLKSGAVWKLYFNGTAGSVRFDDRTTSSCGFVAVRLEGEKPVLAKAVGAGRVELADGQAFDSPAFNPLKIDRVDYENNVVYVTGTAPAVGKHGSVVLASRGDALKASYTVTEASTSDAHVALKFGETQLLTGRFEAAWDPASSKVVAKERIGGVYNQFVAKSFVGMSVVSEDLKHTAVIRAADDEKNTFSIDADEATAAAFKDQDGDGRAYVYIADLAPGVTLDMTPTRTIVLTPETNP